MYNKQTWKDEIPDLTKPVLDANGKQKTDLQTGRPLFELVQEGTRITSTRLNSMETGIGGAHELTELLSKELGGNFVVSSEGGLGIKFTTVGLTVSWSAGVAYVGGRRFEVSAGSLPLNPTQGQYLYLDLDGKIKKTTSEATAITALLLWYVATDASGVITSTDKRSTVNMAEILKRIENITVPPASLTQKGIVQLSNATNGTRETVAATEKAIKQVSDTIPSTAAQITIADSANYFASTEVEGVLSEIGSSLSERTLELTNPVGKTATINSGTQVIQGGVAPAIAFPKVEGRTLINLLGRSGDCEFIGDWTVAQPGAISLDDRHVSGAKGILVSHPTVASTSYFFRPIKLDISKYYYFSGHALSMLEVAFTIGSVVANESGGGGIVRFNPNSTLGFTRRGFKFKPTIADQFVTAYVYGASGITTAAVFDAMALYEVSAAEYAAIDSMTSDQIAAKYPYVGTGIHGIKDVTITSVQDNLFPPFSEPVAGVLVPGNTHVIEEPYRLKITKTSIGFSTVAVAGNVESGKEYTFSTNVIVSNIGGTIGFGAYYNITSLDNSGAFLESHHTIPYITSNGAHILNKKFTTHSTATKVIIAVGFDSGATGEAIFENPMLTKSSIAQSFKPQSKTTLTAYTELHSNTDGTVKDTLEYVNGRAKKLKRFERVALDGSLSWVMGNVAPSGMKQVKIMGYPLGPVIGSGVATKFDGKIIPYNSTAVSPDNNAISVDGNFYLSISNADSGWGDAYTPTAAEIKAYFNGYKMAHIDGTPYLTGTKYWNKRYAGIGTPKTYPDGTVLVDGWVTLTVPTGLNEGFTPYQLLYQLATPITEDVQTSGAIVLESGDNYVTALSTSVPMLPSTLTYANSFYSALSDAEREIARVDLVRENDKKSILADNTKQVPHLGTTTNVGDAYSITTSETISTNQKFTIKFNAVSTTAPILSINGVTAKSIKKPNGNNAKLYASVYTLFLDGVNFILQGEGGEYGTAVAADVLAGKSLGTEGGLVSGAMADRGSIGTQNLTTQNQEYTVQQGYHDGTGKVKAVYVAKGKTGSGTTTTASGGELMVTGLGFTPRIVRIRSAYSTFPKPITVMHRGVQDFSGAMHDIFATLDPGGTAGYGGDSTMDSKYTITSGGFTASIRTGNIPVYWEAEE